MQQQSLLSRFFLILLLWLTSVPLLALRLCTSAYLKCWLKVLPIQAGIISQNLSAFIQGRNISDCILVAQELVRNSHRRGGPQRCAFNVDLRKAYDSLQRPFLFDILAHLLGSGNHRHLSLVTTPSFSGGLAASLGELFVWTEVADRGDSTLSNFFF